MKATSITDLYMAVLSSLSRENKIMLATQLLNSAAEDSPAKVPLTLDTHFSGDWWPGKTADEAAEDLRNNRKFNRNVSTW